MPIFETFAELGEKLVQIIARTAQRVAARVKLAAASVVETLTGRSCEKCEHFAKGSCWHPDFDTRDQCMTSLRPVGYKKRCTKASDGLTDEERYQLQKIKGVLQEAEDAARESGLLED